MSAGLVTQVKVVMRLVVSQLQDAYLQCLVTFARPCLASCGGESFGVNSDRHTRFATVAVRSVSEEPASTKALTNQFRVNIVVDHVTGGRHLRAGGLVAQITAGVRCRCIKLQGV